MSVYVSTFGTSSNGAGLNSYLSASDALLFLYPSNASESFFGNSDKDLFHIGLYDVNNNLISYIEEQSTKKYFKTNYVYTDIYGNSFNYYYNKIIPNILLDTNKNTLFDISNFINTTNPSSSFDLLVNPVTNIFSSSGSLIVSAIGASGTELKLMPTFNYTIVNEPLNCEVSGSQILINGKNVTTVKGGGVYTITSTVDVSNLYISNVKNGPSYSTGVLFKNSKNKIVLDLTKTTVSSLWLCDKYGTGSAAEIVVSGSIASSDFVSSIEFSTLDDRSYVTKQIYTVFVNGLNLFNIPIVYEKMAQQYPDYVNSIKTSFNFSSDSQIIGLISSIYYGMSTYDDQLNQEKNLDGIYSYILNYLNFNYEFSGTFENLSNEIADITTATVNNFAEFGCRGSRGTVDLQQAISFISAVFNNFLEGVLVSTESSFITKFKRPLSNALYFGSGSVYPIVNSRIDIINNSPVYVVKLKDSLDSNVTQKTICENVINISVEPFLQTISYLSASVVPNIIRLTTPNFTVATDGYSLSSPKKTPYFNNQMLSLTPPSASVINTTITNQTFNIDFSNFQNFVVFSSANMRVKIFENKIISLTTLQAQQATLTSASMYSTQQMELSNIASQIQSIYQSFDFYETYLYNTNMFNYNLSSSMFVEFNGKVYRPSSYVSNLEASARVYDKQNVDSLVSNTPEYIRDDSDNDDYLKFVCMIGHYFDNLYLYVSNFAFYNKIGNDYSDGIQKNILKYIINSFGLNVPPCLSTGTDDSTLEEFYLSSDESHGLQNNISLDNKTKLIWKRILNNLPLLYKSKGTYECMRYIFSIYGIPENLIEAREFGGGYSSADINPINTKTETVYAPEFIGTSGEQIIVKNLNGFNSVDFKLYLEPSKYDSLGKVIVPICSRYIIFTSGSFFQRQFSSFGVIKETKDIGRVYFLIRDITQPENSDPTSFKFVSEPIVLFDGSMYNVAIKRGDSINEVFDTSLVQYNILVSNTTNISDGESYNKFTFYLPVSSSNLYQSSSNDSWGNSIYLPIASSSYTSGSSSYSYSVSQSIDVIGELRGISLQINDFSGSFNGVGSISDIIDNSYQTASFYGCLDRVTYQQNSIDDNTFINKSYNYDYYCDGNSSGSANNILYRFYFYPPIDIAYSSSVSGGYSVSNFNSNYPNITSYMQNFIGGNFITTFNTSSCASESLYAFPYQFREFDVNNTYFVREVGPDRNENDKINKVSLKNDFDFVSVKNRVSVKSSDNDYQDSNKFGLFLSPTSDRNEDILNFFGKEPIISTIASPSNIYSDSYSSLKTLRDNFYSIKKSKILFNELFTIYKIYVDKSIFDIVRNFLPSRNKVYSGVLIEPTILERPKIKSRPLSIKNHAVLSASIQTNKVSSNQIQLMSASASVNVGSNFTYPYNFNDFNAINDVPDNFQLSVFSENGICGFGGGVYKVYLKSEPKSIFNQEANTVTGNLSKTFKKMILVKNSSTISFGSTYSLMTDRNYYNNLSFKPLSLRKTSVLLAPNVNNITTFIKSRETSNTTINNSNLTITSNSPVISTVVGNVLKQGINV